MMPNFRFYHYETETMHPVLNLCFYGAPMVTVAYNPVEKYRLDSGDLMQMTGFLDKKGTPIFEGDILKASPYNEHFSSAEFVVQFENGAFSNRCFLRMTSNDGKIRSCKTGGFAYCSHLKQEYLQNCEIIGNIHEK